MNKNQMVIVRCKSSGVFFGTLAESDLKHGLVTLERARRIWYWDGAATLSQLAMEGTSKPENCKFPVAVTEIQLTEVIEVIKCTPEAVASIEGVKVWKQ